MLLYLVRHGIAIDRDDPDCPEDKERQLSPKGLRRTRRAITGLKKLGAQPARIYSSNFLRAEETATIAAEILGLPDKHIYTTDALLYWADPQAFRRLLLDMRGLDEVICCGHAPNLDRIIADLLGVGAGTVTRLKKAGVACIDLEPDPNCHGRLKWLLEPRTLRNLADT